MELLHVQSQFLIKLIGYDIPVYYHTIHDLILSTNTYGNIMMLFWEHCLQTQDTSPLHT